MRIILITLGTVSLLLGLIGLLLPLLPTTPFILVAAACYAHSSERMYQWLLNNRWFGQCVRDWQTHRSLSWRTKIVAVVLLAISLTFSVIWFEGFLPLQVLLIIIGLLVSWFIVSRPTAPSS